MCVDASVRVDIVKWPVAPWLFDVCISPAVMTVAAAGCVSGELIISVCQLWRGWSCDTGDNHTASLFWCRHRRCICMCVYVFVCRRIYLKCFAYNRERYSHPAWCSCHCAVHVAASVFICMCTLPVPPVPPPPVLTLRKWHQTSVCCHCGNTTGVGVSAWVQRQRRRGRKRDGQWGNRTEWEKIGGEMERWPDKPCGSLHGCPKGSHLSSPSLPTWPEGKFQLCNKTATPLPGTRAEVTVWAADRSYCWPRVYAITHHCGAGLVFVTALINTLLFIR